MNLDDINVLLELLEKHPLEEIKYTFSNGESVHLVKEKKHATYVTPSMHYHEPHQQQSVPSKPQAEAPPAQYEQVKSPIVGTFYSAASPDKPPFVKVGDKVEAGQTLCIIEAMKILNPVTSPYSGTIKTINISNEEPVEYNQVLFEIEA